MINKNSKSRTVFLTLIALLPVAAIVFYVAIGSHLASWKWFHKIDEAGLIGKNEQQVIGFFGSQPTIRNTTGPGDAYLTFSGPVFGSYCPPAIGHHPAMASNRS